MRSSFDITTNNSRLSNSRTPIDLEKSPPFYKVSDQNQSDVRDNMQRLYRVPGHSYLTPWGNNYIIGKASPKKLANKIDLSLNISDIEGAQRKSIQRNLNINKSLVEADLGLPEIRNPYYPRKHALNEITGKAPSPEISRKMGLLEQLQHPKPYYLSVRRKYAAPNKHGKSIRLFIEEKLTPKIGSKWD